jgi:Arc/MetJ family transcription regulator
MARTTLDIDDQLIARARDLSTDKTKRAIVEEALREYINSRLSQELIAMIGTDVIDLTPEELRQMRGCDEPSVSD